MDLLFSLRKETNSEDRIYQKQLSIIRFFKGLFTDEWEELGEPIRFGEASMD